MGHTSRSIENDGTENDLNSGNLAHEVLEENNLGMLLSDLSCDILEKTVAAFCPHSKSLPETKVKIFGLIPMTEAISKQPSFDSVV